MTDKDKLLDFLNSAGIPYHISKDGSCIIIGSFNYHGEFAYIIPPNTLDYDNSTGYPHFYHEFIFNDNGKLMSSRTWE